MLLLDFARNEVGVTMGSLAHGRNIGWTTDAAKAERLREAGARVQSGFNVIGPCGWEISFGVGAELIVEVAA